jgi:hypothetical protein
MPGARAGRTVMIVVAAVVVAGMLVAMLGASLAVPAR